jgi:hypothetical protein
MHVEFVATYEATR